MQGSVPTPYIYDSRPTIEDITSGLEFWKNQSKSERIRKGISGRNWAIENNFTEKGMNEAMSSAIQTCFDSFKPKQSYELIETDMPKPVYPSGVLK